MRNTRSGHGWRCCCCLIFASQTHGCKIISTSNLKAGHRLISLNLTDLNNLFNLTSEYDVRWLKTPDSHTTRAWPHVCSSWKGLRREGRRKYQFNIVTKKKNIPKTKQVIKSDLTKCSRSLKNNYFSVFREPTAAQVKTDQSYQSTKALLACSQFCFIVFVPEEIIIKIK